MTSPPGAAPGQVVTLAGTDNHFTFTTPSTGSAAGVLTVTNNATNVITTTGSPLTLPATLSLTAVMSPTFTGLVTMGSITAGGGNFTFNGTVANLTGTYNQTGNMNINGILTVGTASATITGNSWTVGTQGSLTSTGVLSNASAHIMGGNLVVTGGGTLTPAGLLTVKQGVSIGAATSSGPPPIQLTTGTVTASPALGSFEFVDVDYYLTASGLGSPVVTFITSTTASTWTVPSDWNNASNSIECVGGGGGGAAGRSGSHYGSGGGGGGLFKDNQRHTDALRVCRYSRWSRRQLARRMPWELPEGTHTLMGLPYPRPL